MRLIGCLLGVAFGFAWTPDARADPASPLPEVMVAGRWLRLPLPQGFCLPNMGEPSEREFANGQALAMRASGRKTLLLFVSCDEMKDYHDSKREFFAFGSYTSALVDDAAYVLPEGLDATAFLGIMASRSPDKFDLAEAAQMLAGTGPRGEAGARRTGIIASTPDALYVASLQRIPKRSKTRPETFAASLSATTVLARVPVIATIIRFGTNTDTIEGLLAESTAQVAMLQGTNAAGPPPTKPGQHTRKRATH